MESQAGSTYRRSAQLAEYVRGLNGRACAAGRPTCVVFNGRDGRPYVQVHHMIPMALQHMAAMNLDRSTNMVPLCPGCHMCLHHGQNPMASAVLDDVLVWFGSVHGMSFESANSDTGFDTSSTGLMNMYGAGLL